MNFDFTGSSMLPTLKPGDQLMVISSERVSVGDVVVFYSNEERIYVAHRVVSIGSSGVKTRGDNLNYDDARLLQSKDIIGLVISAKRGHRTLLIRGGRRGIQYARMLWKWNPLHTRLFNNFMYVAGFPYRVLSDSALFRRLNPFRITPKVVLYRRTDGFESQLLWGKRVIGRRMPGEVKWQLRRPFRLFVDESSLPE
jgi:signal peptidase